MLRSGESIERGEGMGGGGERKRRVSCGMLEYGKLVVYSILAVVLIVLTIVFHLFLSLSRLCQYFILLPLVVCENNMTDSFCLTEFELNMMVDDFNDLVDVMHHKVQDNTVGQFFRQLEQFSQLASWPILRRRILLGNLGSLADDDELVLHKEAIDSALTELSAMNVFWCVMLTTKDCTLRMESFATIKTTNECVENSDKMDEDSNDEAGSVESDSIDTNDCDDCDGGNDRNGRICDYQFENLVTMVEELSHCTSKKKKKQCRLNQLKLLWDIFLSKLVPMNRVGNKSVTVADASLLCMAGYQAPWRHTKYEGHPFNEYHVPVPSLVSLVRVVTDAWLASPTREVEAVQAMKSAARIIFGIQVFPIRDVEIGAIGNVSSAYFDRCGNEATDTINCVEKDVYQRVFGADGKALVECVQELLNGNYLVVATNLVSLRRAGSPPTKPNVAVFPLWAGLQGSLWGGLILIVEPVFDSWTESYIWKYRNKVPFMDGKSIGNLEKPRAVNVCSFSDDCADINHMVFQLGNSKIPLAAHGEASVEQRLLMSMMSRLHLHVENKLIRPNLPEGMHYLGF